MCIFLEDSSKGKFLDRTLAIIIRRGFDRDVRGMRRNGFFDIEEACAAAVGRAQTQKNVKERAGRTGWWLHSHYIELSCPLGKKRGRDSVDKRA